MIICGSLGAPGSTSLAGSLGSSLVVKVKVMAKVSEKPALESECSRSPWDPPIGPVDPRALGLSTSVSFPFFV